MLLTLLFAAATAQANCDDARTQADINRCYSAAYTRADAAMTREWRATYAVAKADGAQAAAATLNSQRAWIAFRDAQCTAEAASYAGGSMQPMIRSSCLTRLTEGRSQQLRAMRSRN